MNSIKLEDRELAAKLVSLLFRLRSLDQVWTSYLASAKAIPDADIVHLESITNEMRQLLVRVPTEVRWLAKLVDQSTYEMEHLITQAVQEAPVNSEMKEAFRQKTTRDTKLVPDLRTKIDQLVNESDSEAATLAKKMHTILQGEYVPGDLGFLCALGAGLVVGGALTLDPVAVGVGLAVVAGEC